MSVPTVPEYDLSAPIYFSPFLWYNITNLEQVNGNWSVGELVYPFGRDINLEMTVSDVDALYQRVLEHNVPVFRELTVSEYR